MRANLQAASFVAAVLGATFSALPWARAGDGPSPPAIPAPRDAAERVQEGNVQNWIEYYRRTREPAPAGAQRPVTGSPAGPDGAGNARGEAKRGD